MLQPLLWGLSFIVLAILTKSTQKRKRRIWIGLVVLFVFSNQALFFEVSKAWEIEPISKKVINKNHYEVAIILGGISTYDHKHQSLEFNSNADRLMKVVPLYFSGSVNKILFSGGSGKLNSEEKESHFIRDYLIELGVKPSDIIAEDRSRNTFENVKYSTQLLKDKGITGNILLSTSSTHMYRSKLCFDKIGIPVQIFPTDHIAIHRELNPYSLLVPDPTVLSHWHNLIHEWVGILVYKVRGYC